MSDDYLSHGSVDRNLKILDSKAAPVYLKSKDDMYLSGYGRHWGEKTTYNLGLAYGSGLFLGGSFGLVRGLKTPATSFRLFTNTVLNSCAQHGPLLGNRFAAMTFFYCTLGGVFTLISPPYLDPIQPFVSGAASGFVYKIAAPNKVRVFYAAASSVVFPFLDALAKRGYI